jgi:autotransporter family porin
MTHMRLRLIRAAAMTAAAGGAAVLCLGAARDVPAVQQPGPVKVPCLASALSLEISTAVIGETLSLAPGCTYVLTTTGLPAITKALTIDGHGDTVERSYTRGTPSFTVFTVESAGNLTLNDVNVQHGGGVSEWDGAAIDSDGDVTINGGTFSNGIGGEFGGAILSDGGTLNITNAAFLNNTGYYSGAIYNEGAMTVIGTSFTGNTGTDDEGGAIYNEDEALITGSTFTDNSSYEGGAIYNDYEMTVTGSSFTGNTAVYGGGIDNEDYATLTGDTFTGNDGDYGGGFYSDYEANVDNSSFLHNTSYYGGGIYNDSNKDSVAMEIQHDLISRNSATAYGGGIFNDGILTSHTTFTDTDNTAVAGGGIYNDGTVDMIYAQISGNQPDNCEPAVTGCSN